ncbi:MAG: 16S rRNA (cytidine(1402)-2'-O)-methyltransferase [Spirochaetales bacterium]|nr:16S rRNA (cytidine(1402)-2'-O)-methyltransferase [Spirochaetales bacterium]
MEELVRPALYVVASPIGHLDDLTVRARHLLSRVDLILCEDTRQSVKLLDHHGIATPRKSFRIHRLREDMAFALSKIQEGQALAFLSDAGTPGISDPGAELVRYLREALPDLTIRPLPGASALTAALSVCGFSASPMVFLGFLSPRSGRRERELTAYRDFPGIIVFFESVHRILATLDQVSQIFPHREVFLAREISKKFEELRLWKGAADSFSAVKGEFTVVLGPEKAKDKKKHYVVEHLDR